MLAKFAVKNFRGFTDRIELDLTRHSNYSFNAFAINLHSRQLPNELNINC